MKTHFIVQTASAKTKSKYGKYGKVAILEVEYPLKSVSRIYKKAKGVVQVVEVWDQLCIGKTDRSAFWRTFKEAEEECERLNQLIKSEKAYLNNQYYIYGTRVSKEIISELERHTSQGLKDHFLGYLQATGVL